MDGMISKNPSEPENSEERRTLGSLLRRAYEGLAHEVYARMAEEGFNDVRPAHSSAFRHIPPQGARTVDLAARTGMRKQSMGYLLDDLETLGYVHYSPDPTDGRARIVRLTHRGEAAVQTLERLSAEVESTWAARLGARDWAATRRTLDRLVSLINGPESGLRE